MKIADAPISRFVQKISTVSDSSSTKYMLCPECSGSGNIDCRVCSYCNGFGSIAEVNKTISSLLDKAISDNHYTLRDYK